MIHYFVTRRHRYTMVDYLRHFGCQLADRVRVTPYEDLRVAASFEPGTFIFSDHERLTPALTRVASWVGRRLEAAGGVRILSHPDRVLRRADLLQRLHERGINRFTAHRLPDGLSDCRYPAFLRRANEHEGSFSELLRDGLDAREAIADAVAAGIPPRDLLLVEFMPTADASGLYRKYSAFCVGGRIIPRHLIFGQGWVLKVPTLIDEAKLAEEWAFLDTNPHESQLREVFALAGIDYGRVDYGVADGRVQVWEINTNPTVMMWPHEYEPAHLPQQEWFAPRIEAAIRELDDHADGSPIELRVPLPLRLRLRMELHLRYRREQRKRVA